MKRLTLIAYTFLTLTNSCTKETTIFYPETEPMLISDVLLAFNKKQCFTDKFNGIMKFSLQKEDLNNFSPLVEFQSESEVWFNSKQLVNNEINVLGDLEYGKAYPLKIISNKIIKKFNIYFTSFAIARIVHIEEIKDEPKSLARIYINSTLHQSMFDSYIGIEIRGNFSQRYEKKSFGFSLSTKRDFSELYTGEILNMNKAEDWILDAVYDDPSKMRNRVCTEIWQDLFSTNNVQANIQFEYVELFKNHEYQGIYILSQALNPELLNISNSNTVLYKADGNHNGLKNALDTLHTSQPIDNLFWDGWSQVHPKNVASWSLFSELRKNLINGTNNEFRTEITNLIDFSSFIDYFIFMNLCAAHDNTGDNKNLYLMGKKSNSQLTVIPWDLNLTFGTGLNQGTFNTNNILTNNLYNRLENINPANYKGQLKNRWLELRNSSITADNLFKIFQKKFDLLEQNKIQNFDNNIWSLNQDYEREKNFIQTWINKRIIRLDNYFSML